MICPVTDDALSARRPRAFSFFGIIDRYAYYRQAYSDYCFYAKT